MPKLSRIRRTLSILTLILLLTLLSTPSSATSCPNDPEQATKIEALRSGIQGELDTPYERLLEALALKLTENCDLRDQRNVAIDNEEKARGERDRVAGQNDKLEKDNFELNAKVAPLIVDNTLMSATIRKLKQQRWLLAGSALLLGVGAGVFATIWVSK